ncbi:MAG: hypothetical protein WD069_18120 [Planctomycetales bacterium]
MSGIGSTGVGGLSIASSVAGTQRSGTDTERVQANAEAARFRSEREAQANRSLGDVTETENSPDRDADGRLLHDDDGTARRRRRLPDAGALTDDAPRAADADGERGAALDLEA